VLHTTAENDVNIKFVAIIKEFWKLITLCVSACAGCYR